MCKRILALLNVYNKTMTNEIIYLSKKFKLNAKDKQQKSMGKEYFKQDLHI